jgi:phytoene dehydrogenase-like protein
MIIIVGAGLAGLACATRLESAGADWMLLEASRRPGGRVSTEVTGEGFRIDRGFQVLLDSYPTARRLLDYPALKPRYFESGAILASRNGGWERLINPLSDPRWFLAASLTKSFTLRQKISLASYAGFALMSGGIRHDQPECGRTTLAEIERLGLSGRALEDFLRPFFAGVFLDNDLRTDASVFRRDLRNFCLGKALLPAGGMSEIPFQLSGKLPTVRQHYGEAVTALLRQGDRIKGVELSGGRSITCDALVLATDEPTSRRLLGMAGGREWSGVTTLYFTGEERLYEGGLLILPSGKDSLVRHFTDLTNTAPEYAPAGRRLLSATLLHPPSNDLPRLAHDQISQLLPGFRRWKFLTQVHIPMALPSQVPGSEKQKFQSRIAPNLWVAGDQVSQASIDSVLASGLKTAEDLLGVS